MKKWIASKWGYLIFPVYVIVFCTVIYLAIKYDLGEDPYDKDGNPNVEFHQQYNGR
ncbi:hypothetical protein [Paenibacillus sp. LjRoot56]|uniref:hypothetical protein n=1 Tax=Paenibacillus sp. LjRoot56 TaxID=3342333 RepID=UPI003F4FF7B8